VIPTRAFQQPVSPTDGVYLVILHYNPRDQYFDEKSSVRLFQVSPV
jgi:hypothetical protein